MAGGKLSIERQRLYLAAVAFFCVVLFSSFTSAFAEQPAFSSKAAFSSQPVTPYFSSNQSPIIQIHGLPAIDHAKVLGEGQARYRLVNDLASNYTHKQRSNENVLFDGETNRSTFVYARGIGKRWEWGVQIPFVNHDNGSLDGFIVDWHNTFGLPQGGRDTAPRNRLTYRYQRDGVTELLLTKQSSGIGDLRLTAAQQWETNGNSRLAVRGALSLPSGDSDELRGNGSIDVALWATADQHRRWFAFPGSLFGGGGLLLMGNGDVLADQQRRFAIFGSLGAGARVLPWMSLKLQADIHSSLYDDSELEQINSTAVQLLMGGDLLLSKNVKLDIMVSEDIVVHASPDVVFHLGLSVE